MKTIYQIIFVIFATAGVFSFQGCMTTKALQELPPPANLDQVIFQVRTHITALREINAINMLRTPPRYDAKTGQAIKDSLDCVRRTVVGFYDFVGTVEEPAKLKDAQHMLRILLLLESTNLGGSTHEISDCGNIGGGYSDSRYNHRNLYPFFSAGNESGGGQQRPGAGGILQAADLMGERSRAQRGRGAYAAETQRTASAIENFPQFFEKMAIATLTQ